jgi:hypothetical protein
MKKTEINKSSLQAQYTIIREMTDYELVGTIDTDLEMAYLILLRLLHKKINNGDQS